MWLEHIECKIKWLEHDECMLKCLNNGECEIKWLEHDEFKIKWFEHGQCWYNLRLFSLRITVCGGESARPCVNFSATAPTCFIKDGRTCKVTKI